MVFDDIRAKKPAAGGKIWGIPSSRRMIFDDIREETQL